MNSKTLLGIAVALNVALGALLLSGKKGATRLSAAGNQPAQIVTNSVIKKVRERIEVASQPELVQLDWRNVESPEYKTYISNLRAIRCPEETIRDIIIADVNKLYAAQWKANRRTPKKDWNYWQGDDQQYEYRYRSKERREDDRLRQKMEREKRDLLRDLLGIEVDKETRNYSMGDYEDQRDRSLTFLPEEKRKQIREIQDRWQKQMQEFYEATEPGEPWSAEQQKKHREMMKTQEAEIGQLLSPQEKEEYELRSSNSANSLRHELAAFEPSEEEFKKLFRLRKAFDERFADFVHDPDDEAGQKRWSQAHSEMKKEIKALLDEPRRAEYDRSQDYEYRETLAMFRSMELGRDVTAKVMDMKKLVEEQVQKVRADRTLSDDQRKTTLKEMRDETEKALTETLGEKGLKRYKNERGWWIRNLR